MSQITDLPSGPMSRILLHLNPKERALFTQSCSATQHFPVEADSATTQAYVDEVSKVISVVEGNLKVIEGQVGQPGQWMLDRQIVFGRADLKALKTHLDELQNQTANDSPIRDFMLNQHQVRIQQIVSQVLRRLHGMHPQTSCFKDLQVGEFCFLRSSIQHAAKGCQVMPSLSNRACGLALCVQLMKDGRVNDAIESAFAIQSIKEKEKALEYLCSEFVRLDQLPKIMEVMNRMDNRLSCSTILQNTWNSVYNAYCKEELPEKRLERSSFLIQLLRRGSQIDGNNSIDYAIEVSYENGTIEDMDGLIALLKKSAQSPGLDNDTKVFLSNVLAKCAEVLCRKRQSMQLLQVISIIPDAAEQMCCLHSYFSEARDWPLLQDPCFSHTFRSLAVMSLIESDLREGMGEWAEQRLSLIQDPQVLSHAHSLIAGCYVAHANNIPKMEEHALAIFDEPGQMRVFSDTVRLAHQTGRFDEAVLYASMLSENPELIPNTPKVLSRSEALNNLVQIPNTTKVLSRSEALYNLVQSMNIAEWFERIVPLILSMRDQGLRENALSKVVNELYDYRQPNAVIERIMTLQDSTMRDCLFEALILSHCEIREAGIAEFLRGAAQLISDVNMRNNMLALIRHTLEADEEKAD